MGARGRRTSVKNSALEQIGIDHPRWYAFIAPRRTRDAVTVREWRETSGRKRSSRQNRRTVPVG